MLNPGRTWSSVARAVHQEAPAPFRASAAKAVERAKIAASHMAIRAGVSISSAQAPMTASPRAATQALATSSNDGAAMVVQARELLATIAGPLSYYGKLASEELGQPLVAPAKPVPVPRP